MLVWIRQCNSRNGDTPHALALRFHLASGGSPPASQAQPCCAKLGKRQACRSQECLQKQCEKECRRRWKQKQCVIASCLLSSSLFLVLSSLLIVLAPIYVSSYSCLSIFICVLILLHESETLVCTQLTTPPYFFFFRVPPCPYLIR